MSDYDPNERFGDGPESEPTGPRISRREADRRCRKWVKKLIELSPYIFESDPPMPEHIKQNWEEN